MSETTSQNRKFLIFTLHNVSYALNLAEIAEVADPPLLSPIPLVPDFYSGALNYHGDIIAVINLSLFLGLTCPTPPGKILILQKNCASLAFLVESVVRIVSEDDVSFKSVPNKGFSDSVLAMSGGEALHLDIKALVHAAESCLQRRK